MRFATALYIVIDSYNYLSGKECAVKTVDSDFVNQLEARIAEKVGPQRFKLWFKNTTRFHVTDGYLKVGVGDADLLPRKEEGVVGDWPYRRQRRAFLEAHLFALQRP